MTILGRLISPIRWACCADSEKIAADRNLPFQRLSSINGGTLLAPLHLPSQINTLCTSHSESVQRTNSPCSQRISRLVADIIVVVAYYFMRFIFRTRFINDPPPLAGIEAHRDPCGGGRAQSHTRCTSQEAPSSEHFPRPRRTLHCRRSNIWLLRPCSLLANPGQRARVPREVIMGDDAVHERL